MLKANHLLGVSLLAVAAFALPNALAAPAMQDQQQEQAEKPAREPTDFRKLREWLPAEAGGLKRSDATGQRIGTGADRISMATATYGDENHEKSINIVVTDFSASQDPSQAAFWKDQEIDSESDTGYSKTTKIEGYAAYETFDSSGNSGNLMILVEDRLVVTVYTSGLDKAAFEKVRDGLGLKKLGEVAKGATTKPATGEGGEAGA